MNLKEWGVSCPEHREVSNGHKNYQKIALSYYGHSIIKVNNSAVMIISVLFLHPPIGDDDYHFASSAIMIITNALKQK